MHILRTLSVLAMILPVVACNSQTMTPAAKKVSSELSAEIVKKSKYEGYKAVKVVLDVYVSNLPGKLETLVSSNFMPSKSEFINYVERSSLDKNIRNIEVVVDEAIFTGDTFSVTYDWNRAYMIRGNAYYTRDEGRTNFVFVKEVGGWRLQQVSGADIF